MTAPTAARLPPTDGPFRLRLAGAMAISLAVHALIISLQLGLPGIGLPALELPWRERRAQSADLQVVLAPPAPLAAAEAAPSAPPPAAESTPAAGLRLVPLPPAPMPKAGTKRSKSKPAASRPPRPRIKRKTPVIALKDTRDSRFNMPAPVVDEVLPATEPEDAPSPAAPEDDAAAREREQAALHQAEEERVLRAREAEELAAQQQQQQAEAARRQEEAAHARALALEQERQHKEAQRLALEEQRKAEEASRQATALALQRQREETQRRESEEASRRALELEEKQRAEALRLQEERVQRDAMELQAKKQSEAAEAARLQAAARERERQAEELAARRQAETDAGAPKRQRDPDLVLGDNPAPGARIDALPRTLGGGLAGRALEQARRGDVLRNDVPVAHDTGSAAEQPRRRSFLGGKDVDVGVMMYVESWRLKIERNGSIMYPRAAVDKAQGDPVVTVAVRSDGSVESVVIHRSSGRAELDEAVHRIVRVNARYSAFPPELARRFDVIEIRKVWNFDDRLRILEEVR